MALPSDAMRTGGRRPRRRHPCGHEWRVARCASSMSRLKGGSLVDPDTSGGVEDFDVDALHAQSPGRCRSCRSRRRSGRRSTIAGASRARRSRSCGAARNTAPGRGRRTHRWSGRAPAPRSEPGSSLPTPVDPSGSACARHTPDAARPVRGRPPVARRRAAAVVQGGVVARQTEPVIGPVGCGDDEDISGVGDHGGGLPDREIALQPKAAVADDTVHRGETVLRKVSVPGPGHC